MSMICSAKNSILIDAFLIVSRKMGYPGSIGYYGGDNPKVDILDAMKQLKKEFTKQEIEIVMLHDNHGVYTEYQPMEIWDDLEEFKEATRNRYTRRMI
jgi:hypothetical protein